MSKTLKKALSVMLALCMVFAVVAALASCSENNGNTSEESKADQAFERGNFTYKSYTTALGNNWNPHSWETNADDAIQSYISSPFCTMSIKDSENGVYQWVYEMATEIKDVTKDNQGDLTKYGVTLQSGKTAETTDAGYVFEIKLNPNAKWENGKEIKADDYIYSMKQLLDSKMKNYRSNLYWGGESAVAGGLAYYNSESPIYSDIFNGEGYETTDDKLADGNLYFSLSQACAFFGDAAASYYTQGYSAYFVVDDVDIYAKWADEANAFGFIKITAENYDEVTADLVGMSQNFGDNNPEAWKEWSFYISGTGEKVDYDGTVGCYKVDDYTIRYVTQTYIDFNYFLTSCTSTWLVYEDLYEAGKDTTGELVTTNYGTSKETSMSYGTYKIESLQDDKQIVFVQNENWYGFENKDGYLVSFTNFDVDGKKVQQYQATKIIIDVMTDEAAKEAFLKGDLTEWSPDGDDLVTYATSDYLYKVDETYTQSFFFNTDENALKEMDKSKGNKNSIVLSNVNFRRAFSLCIDRAKYVTATAGYKPAYYIMNSLYFYDVYNDPTSSYRNSDEAMQAIVTLYDVEYGEGKTYATLKDAYKSITGYNLTMAQDLMKQAARELIEGGLYTAGEDITIRIGWAKGALQSSDNKLVTMLNEFINAAVDGTDFGKVTFEAVDNIPDRYGDVPKGEYAIGYGAWGGAAFYPFRNFQVYMDPANYSIHEGGCWDPTTEKWTLTVNGKDETMTCQEWSNCLIGNGKYAEADFATKLSITAQLELSFLRTYYRIPLCTTTACFMMSKQVKYYTNNYNIMYDFGGLRLLSFNYTDEAWADYCKSGELNY